MNKLKIDKKSLMLLFSIDIGIVVVVLIAFSANPTYEEGEEIEDNGNLITVMDSKKIDSGTATMDGEYFRVYVKYIVPEGPKLGTQPELFRLQNTDGDLYKLEEVHKDWDDVEWVNIEGVKDYDGLLYLVRVDGPDSDDIEYRVRLRPEE